MSDKIKDHIGQLYDNNIYIPSKTIILSGGVDEDMYNTAVKGIHILDSYSGPINIKLMSEGGDLTVARALFDIIQGCKNYVRVIVYGEAASAATIILQAADSRVMTHSSKLMLHVGAESIPEDHPRNVDQLYVQHRIDEKWIEDTYLKRIKEKKKRFTRQQLKNLLTWDKYLTPKESFDLGIIDEIGEPQ
jgi:ATP-dependent Clp protease protease subunit